ncbi:MAG: CPBP family intramembrane metalloprotease [Clostridiaceae bacterium]|nr:CPBP family intramembrane metalloprotease [Clostridiaceae bacterium]
MSEQYNPNNSSDVPDTRSESYVWQPDYTQPSDDGVTLHGASPLHTAPLRHVSARTFLAPLTLMVLHHVVLNVASLVHLFVFLLKNPEIKAELLEKANDNVFLLEVMIEADVMTFASLFGMLVLIPLYLGYLFILKKKRTPLLLVEPLAPRQAIGAMTVILGAMGLTQLWMVLLSSLDEVTVLGRLFQEYLEKMALFDGRTSTQFLELLVTVLLVPIGEELLFRGIIQGELRRAFKPFVSVAATTILFAVFHLDIIQGSYVLIAGFALSIVYHFTENIFVPIAMHVLFNFIGSGWLSRLIGAGETAEAAIVLVLYVFVIIGAIGLVILRNDHKNKINASSDRMVI